MVIIVEYESIKVAREKIKDICRDHKEHVKKVLKTNGELHLKNGDMIKFISYNSIHLDGMRADVSIGPHAHYFTHISSHSKRIWQYDDFEKYLNDL